MRRASWRYRFEQLCKSDTVQSMPKLQRKAMELALYHLQVCVVENDAKIDPGDVAIAAAKQASSDPYAQYWQRDVLPALKGEHASLIQVCLFCPPLPISSPLGAQAICRCVPVQVHDIAERCAHSDVYQVLDLQGSTHMQALVKDVEAAKRAPPQARYCPSVPAELQGLDPSDPRASEKLYTPLRGDYMTVTPPAEPRAPGVEARITNSNVPDTTSHLPVIPSLYSVLNGDGSRILDLYGIPQPPAAEGAGPAAARDAADDMEVDAVEADAGGDGAGSSSQVDTCKRGSSAAAGRPQSKRGLRKPSLRARAGADNADDSTMAVQVEGDREEAGEQDRMATAGAAQADAGCKVTVKEAMLAAGTKSDDMKVCFWVVPTTFSDTPTARRRTASACARQSNHRIANGAELHTVTSMPEMRCQCNLGVLQGMSILLGLQPDTEGIIEKAAQDAEALAGPGYANRVRSLPFGDQC